MPPPADIKKTTAATGQPELDPTALNASFEALKVYDQGSSRAALLPIDEAVVRSLDDPAARRTLEQRLVSALSQSGSAVAREFVCSKLTLIGSDSAVPALTDLLNAPETATAARNALEAIPGNKATQALRESLSKVEGWQKIGVIHSLGARRDWESVQVLTRLLDGADVGIAAAAAAALGDIATVKAAEALRDFQTRAPKAMGLKVADAMLNCAERFRAAGKRADATALYQQLATTAQPKHIHLAAAQGLKLTTGEASRSSAH